MICPKCKGKVFVSENKEYKIIVYTCTDLACNYEFIKEV